jgi:hypothetical protein
MDCEERQRLLDEIAKATIEFTTADSNRKVASIRGGADWAAANERAIAAEKDLSAKRAALFTHESKHPGCK